MSETEGTDPNVIDAEFVEDAPTAALPAIVPGAIEPAVPEADYTTSAVPTFDYVRDKIEKRYTTSVGAAEVVGLGTEHTMESLDKKIADRDAAAKDKLAEIRRKMREQ